jgi:hypothetical protein
MTAAEASISPDEPRLSFSETQQLIKIKMPFAWVSIKITLSLILPSTIPQLPCSQRLYTVFQAFRSDTLRLPNSLGQAQFCAVVSIEGFNQL